jgi:hypothetical protein
MAGAQQHNPLAAMHVFIDRVAPFDPAPDGPAAAVVEVVVAGKAERFVLTGYVGRAFFDALCGYYDPADVGP